MKICVFSDSHGYPEAMLRAVERETPEACFFLGDGQGDLAALRAHFPDLTVYAVRGNCDMRSLLPLSVTVTLEGVTFFAAHGHRLDVKHDPSLAELRSAGAKAGAHVILFGHTHEPFLEDRAMPVILNPGSACGTRATYGVVVLHERRIYARIKHL